MSPELLEETDYGGAVDWWALGCVMYEMMAGQLPFYSRDQTTLFTLIMKESLRFPRSLSSSAQSLLGGLLTKDPKARLGAGQGDAMELKEHIFFQVREVKPEDWRSRVQGIDWTDLEERKITPPFKPAVSSMLDTKVLHGLANIHYTFTV